MQPEYREYLITDLVIDKDQRTMVPEWENYIFNNWDPNLFKPPLVVPILDQWGNDTGKALVITCQHSVSAFSRLNQVATVSCRIAIGADTAEARATIGRADNHATKRPNTLAEWNSRLAMQRAPELTAASFLATCGIEVSMSLRWNTIKPTPVMRLINARNKGITVFMSSITTLSYAYTGATENQRFHDKMLSAVADVLTRNYDREISEPRLSEKIGHHEVDYWLGMYRADGAAIGKKIVFDYNDSLRTDEWRAANPGKVTDNVLRRLVW